MYRKVFVYGVKMQLIKLCHYNKVDKFNISLNHFHFNLLKSSGGTSGPEPAAPIEATLVFMFCYLICGF